MSSLLYLIVAFVQTTVSYAVGALGRWDLAYACLS